MTIWRLRAGSDRRFRTGHPWVYSNELAESPKGLEPGAPVELRDAGGAFLARGYGNPHSLIAFRSLSRDPAVTDPASPAALTKTLRQAARIRRTLGLAEVSHRWIFGEADGLPGLIIDRFRSGPCSQVISIQAHTAGANHLIASLMEALESVSKDDSEVPWSETSVILRNDIGIRKLEGIPEEDPRILKQRSNVDYDNIDIRVAYAGAPHENRTRHLELRVDLLKGQKTGFFLDQFANIQLAASRVRDLVPKNSPVRILDLCCYVGQWSAQLARLFLEAGHTVETVAVDSSTRALELAQHNIARQASSELPPLQCETLRLDVLKELGQIPGAENPQGGFDLIVSDPPALIQARKDIPAGTHAYLQLNTQCFRLLRAGGMIISCSCSGLLDENDFLRTLGKAAHRNRTSVRWIGRGAQSPDHPMLSEFPEGRYLKCWIGVSSR